MKKLSVLAFLVGTLVVAAQPAMAQSIVGVKAEPAQAKVGEPVKITATFDLSKGGDCNARITFGDGENVNVRINQEKDANLVQSHTFKKPGTYTVLVEGKTKLPALKCMGDAAKTQITVVAPPPVVASAPAAAAPTAAAAGTAACPTGWTLNAKSVNKKTGAFQCSAKPGTAAPAEKLACPGSLSYVENTKKGQIGCQP